MCGFGVEVIISILVNNRFNNKSQLQILMNVLLTTEIASITVKILLAVLFAHVYQAIDWKQMDLTVQVSHTDGLILKMVGKHKLFEWGVERNSFLTNSNALSVNTLNTVIL